MAATEAEAVARSRNGRRYGSGWLCTCPAHDDRTPSLSVASGRDGRLLVKCHAGCEAADILAALRREGVLGERGQRVLSMPGRNVSARKAVPNPDPGEVADLQRRVGLAADLFNGTVDIRGTPGERYLVEHRGITITSDPATDDYLFDRLRFDPACRFRDDDRIIEAPAIIAAVTGSSGCLRGVWRIRLDGFAQKIERKGLGDCRGGTVRLFPAVDEDHVAIAEGVEDALAFMQMTGIPTWAACSTGGMKGAVLPQRFSRVTIVADADPPRQRPNGTWSEPGIEAATALGNRLSAEGRKVRVLKPPAGFKDANAALAGEVAA